VSHFVKPLHVLSFASRPWLMKACAIRSFKLNHQRKSTETKEHILELQCIQKESSNYDPRKSPWYSDEINSRERRH
jgi:hypothetical protein